MSERGLEEAYELPNLPLLDRDEERELLKKAKLAREEEEKPESERNQRVIQEGKEARDHLVLANHRLVRKMVSFYTGKGVSYADLMVEGLMGLIRAIDKFDLEKETKLATYATWWIRQSLQASLKNFSRTVRVPCHVLELLVSCRKIMDEYHAATGQEMSYEEALKVLGKSKREKLADHLRKAEKANTCLPFPTVSKDDWAEGVGDVVDKQHSDPEEDLIREEQNTNLLRLVRTVCGERQAEALLMHFGIGTGTGKLILQDIGEKLGGVTRERARQLKEKALKTLREAHKQKKSYSTSEGE